MPFVGYPTQTDVKLVNGAFDFTGVVRPSLFLTALGWSTNLNIRLRGHIKPCHLQRFVALLPSKFDALFTVNGDSKSLPEVFEFFANCVRKDVYQPDLIDMLKIKRYLLMTLPQFSGEVRSYRSPIPGVKPMPAADRALFHSILKGKAIEVPDLINLENNKGFLLTGFTDSLEFDSLDFALTYFDYGSLIFMQKTALADDYERWKLRRRAMQCHSSNIRNYLLMTQMLYIFYRDMKKQASSSTEVNGLRDGIKTTLVNLPSVYTNPFCQSFHNNYGPLIKLRSS
jgi:hypothetical protein